MWPYRSYIKTTKNDGFFEEQLNEMTVRLFYPLSVVRTMVATPLRQFRSSLQIKKRITNAPRML